MFEDGKRLMSYIYSYSGDARNKNVGFVKAEVKNQKLIMNITLRGVYTEVPEEYSVRFMVDGNAEHPGVYTLIFVGKCMVNRGLGNFAGEFLCDNIADTGYDVSDISGVALVPANAKYNRLFTMWDDGEIKPDLAIVAEIGYKKSGDVNEDGNAYEEVSDNKIGEDKQDAGQKLNQEVEATEVEMVEDIGIEEPVASELRDESADEIISKDNDWQQDISEEHRPITALDLSGVETEGIEPQIKKLFKDCDYIDAFADDLLYDCIEVTPDQLKTLPVKDSSIVNNSFILHGFYNFRHILFGKVAANNNNTSYFIGVPGMYCNRERFMASMFGFNNFKKSHRSDITNPYFGYWYQEF